MRAATTTSPRSLLRTPLRARMRSLVCSLRRVRGRPGATGDGMLCTIGLALVCVGSVELVTLAKTGGRGNCLPSGTAERRRGEDRRPALSGRDRRVSPALLDAPRRAVIGEELGFVRR